MMSRIARAVWWIVLSIMFFSFLLFSQSILNSINNIDKYIFVFPTFYEELYLGSFLILLGGIFGATKSRKKLSIDERYLSIIVFLCLFFIWSISYGYVTDEGIIYRSFYNLYETKRVPWEDVQSPVTITIDAGRKSFSYSCDLTLKENDEFETFDLFTFIIESKVKAKVPDLIKTLKKHNIELNIIETNSAKSQLANKSARVKDSDFIEELKSLSMN